MKRYYIENLPKEYTEEEYARQVIRIAKRWKREMNVETAEATARESCRIRKNDIGDVLRRKWNALDPKPELTVDEIAKIVIRGCDRCTRAARRVDPAAAHVEAQVLGHVLLPRRRWKLPPRRGLYLRDPPV